jgi:hypothetical protein
MILLVAIGTQSPIASAALKCDSIYASDAEIYARSLSLQKGEDLWSRLLWNSYLRKWSEDKTYLPETFEKKIVASHQLLRRLQIQQGLVKEENFDKNSEEVIRWTEKTLLKEGLKGYLKSSLVGEAKGRPWPQRIYDKVEKLMTTKAFKLIWHLTWWTLPDKADKEMPAPLLAQVMVDGMQPHMKELESAYQLQGQDKIEGYRHLQKKIKYLSLTFTALTGFNRFEHYAVEQAEKQKIEYVEKLNTDLKDIDQGLDEISRLLESGAFDKN